MGNWPFRQYGGEGTKGSSTAPALDKFAALKKKQGFDQRKKQKSLGKKKKSAGRPGQGGVE